MFHRLEVSYLKSVASYFFKAQESNPKLLFRNLLYLNPKQIRLLLITVLLLTVVHNDTVRLHPGPSKLPKGTS